MSNIHATLKKIHWSTIVIGLILGILLSGLMSSAYAAKKQKRSMLAISLGEGNIAFFWPPAKAFYSGGGWQLQDRSTGKIVARWTAKDLEAGIASLPKDRQEKIRPYLKNLKSLKNRKEVNNQIGALLLGGVSDFQLAQKLGMGYTLTHVGKGKRSYRLIPIDKKNRVAGKKITSVAVDSWKPSPLPAAVVKLQGNGLKNGLALLWSTPPDQTVPTPFFQISRTIETGKAENLTPQPIWLSPDRDQDKAAFIDKLAPFETKLTYSVRLRDIFGRLSAPAKVSVVYTDPESLTPPEQLTLSGGKNRVKITWQPKQNPYTTGYIIERSRRHDGLYTVLTDTGLKRKVKSYDDKTAQGGFTYYYRIRSVGQRGTVGNPSAAKEVMVKTASRPKTPSHVIAQVSPTNVHLQWSGQPLPVAGYIIEKKKEKDKIWVRLNSTLATRPEFDDPLNLGDYGKRRYRITAVAFGNQKSRAKEITVTLPGHPPVPAPTISDIKSENGVVKLSFHPSEPVKRTDHFELLRGNSTTDIGLIINQKIGHSKTSYSDKMVKPGEDYWYALIAVDRNGHRSKPSNKLFIIAGSPEIPQPKPPKVKFTAKPFRRVTISFAKPPGFLRTAVMRKVDNQAWLTINRDISGVSEIIDSDPPESGIIDYRIVYLDESHHWGPPSKTTHLNLDKTKK